MKITKKWLEKEDACTSGVVWFAGQKKCEVSAVVNQLILENRFEWANWLLCHVFTRKQKIQYAIFAAEQVLGIFEKRHPDDKRPRQAIDAAKAVLENDTQENRNAATAAYAATAANAAAYAAYATATAAAYAATAAYAAANAAAYATATAAARKVMQEKIIGYGLQLLKKGK